MHGGKLPLFSFFQYFVFNFFISMQCHGGNGFVEDFPLARMYRHAPLNSIWEGSGNVMTLDVLRAAKHIPLFMNEVKLCASAGNATVNDHVSRLERDLFKLIKSNDPVELQRHSRHIVDRMAVALQASVLLRYGDPKIADMYVESRIFSSGYSNLGMNYGSTVYSAGNVQHVLSEHTPVL